MAFKIYFNRKTRHPAISLSGKEKEIWENMELTHHPTDNDSYIDIITITRDGLSQSYVRKYIRKDKQRVKGRRFKRIQLDNTSEEKVKNYLKEKKKDDGNLITQFDSPFKDLASSDIIEL